MFPTPADLEQRKASDAKIIEAETEKRAARRRRGNGTILLADIFVLPHRIKAFPLALRVKMHYVFRVRLHTKVFLARRGQQGFGSVDRLSRRGQLVTGPALDRSRSRLNRDRQMVAPSIRATKLTAGERTAIAKKAAAGRWRS